MDSPQSPKDYFLEIIKSVRKTTLELSLRFSDTRREIRYQRIYFIVQFTSFSLAIIALNFSLSPGLIKHLSFLLFSIVILLTLLFCLIFYIRWRLDKDDSDTVFGDKENKRVAEVVVPVALKNLESSQKWNQQGINEVNEIYKKAVEGIKEIEIDIDDYAGEICVFIFLVGAVSFLYALIPVSVPILLPDFIFLLILISTFVFDDSVVDKLWKFINNLAHKYKKILETFNIIESENLEK